MPRSLHSQKIKDEKDAFVDELYKMLAKKATLKDGIYDKNASLIHKYYLVIYIMNHYNKTTFSTDYYNYMLTSLIESESLCLAGFNNASMMLLRSSMEMAIKFIYFETHPIEWELHQNNKFDLPGLEYRNFLYSVPKFSKLDFENKNSIETIWSELCKYSHYDLSIIQEISIITDIKPIFIDVNSQQKYIAKLKSVIRFMVIILFLVNPEWMQGVEKSYFDYIFEILYKPEEIGKMKIELRIV